MTTTRRSNVDPANVIRGTRLLARDNLVDLLDHALDSLDSEVVSAIRDTIVSGELTSSDVGYALYVALSLR